MLRVQSPHHAVEEINAAAPGCVDGRELPWTLEHTIDICGGIVVTERVNEASPDRVLGHIVLDPTKDPAEHGEYVVESRGLSRGSGGKLYRPVELIIGRAQNGANA